MGSGKKRNFKSRFQCEWTVSEMNSHCTFICWRYHVKKKLECNNVKGEVYHGPCLDSHLQKNGHNPTKGTRFYCNSINTMFVDHTFQTTWGSQYCCCQCLY